MATVTYGGPRVKKMAIGSDLVVREQEDHDEENYSIEGWLLEELRVSKSYYMSWGRKVIKAIDFDDCVALSKVFSEARKKSKRFGDNKVDVDAQVQATTGYGGYLWSAWMHNNYMDTALHLALKQKKKKCVYALLALGARTDIPNQDEITAEMLCLRIYGREIRDLRSEAMRELISLVDPLDFDHLPMGRPYKGSLVREDIKHEAWRLMEQGRCMYSDVPGSFQFLDLVPPKKAFDPWVRRVDPETLTCYMFNNLSGRRRPLDEKEAKEVAKGWRKELQPDGTKIFVHEITKQRVHSKPAEFEDSDDEKQALDEIMKEMDNYDEDEMLERIRQERQAGAELFWQQKAEEEAREAQAALEEEERQADIEHRKALGIYKEPPTEEELEIKRQLRYQLKAQEDLLGQSSTPGAAAVGDVWSRGTVADVVSMLAAQNRLHRRKEDRDSLAKSGLTLKGVAQDAGGVPEAVRKELAELKGIKKLKFVKMKTLRALADESAAKADFSHVRWISTLSTQTNMKYMNIGDSGLARINEQLNGCRFVTTVVLSAARVTSSSVCGLMKIVHSISALTYLDLSSNAICDVGGAAVAEAFDSRPRLSSAVQSPPPSRPPTLAKQHSNITTQSLNAAAQLRIPLKTLCLQGNRLTALSMEKLVAAVCHREGSIAFMSLQNNHLRKAERLALQGRVDTYNSWARVEDDQAQKLIAVEAARIDREWDELTRRRIQSNLATIDKAASTAAAPPADHTPNELLTAANRRKLLSRNASSASLGSSRSASPVSIGSSRSASSLEAPSKAPAPLQRAASGAHLSRRMSAAAPVTAAAVEADKPTLQGRKKPTPPVFVSVAKTVLL